MKSNYISQNVIGSHKSLNFINGGNIDKNFFEKNKSIEYQTNNIIIGYFSFMFINNVCYDNVITDIVSV